MRRIVYVICCVVVLCFTSNAQDIHFSQFFLSPLTLNPANTGNFEGSVRLGGIYRDQWWSVAGSSPLGFNGQFKTYSVSVDAPILKGFREKDWVGVGLMLFQDQSGSLKLKYGASQLSASYHFALDNDRNKVLSIGIQGGAISRKIDQELLSGTDNIFLTELQGGGRSTDRQLIGEQGDDMARGGKTDYSAGILYQGVVGETAFMTLGLAVNHITQPRKPLVNGVTYKLPMRIQAHASVNLALTDKVLLSPTVLYQNVSGKGDELNVAAIAGLIMNESKGVIVNFGVGYRVQDAAELYVGLDYGDFRVGMAYDLNTSGLSPATNSVGALELGATYIAKIYKKPKVDNILFCPRF